MNFRKDFHPKAKSVNAYIVYADEKTAHKATERSILLLVLSCRMVLLE